MVQARDWPSLVERYYSGGGAVWMIPDSRQHRQRSVPAATSGGQF